jgi:hypothetical protein
MSKFKSGGGDSRVRPEDEAQDQLRVGKIEYFEKFSGKGRIIQNDVTIIPFYSYRTTYPVKEGDIVNYRIEMGPMGLQAVDITKKP